MRFQTAYLMGREPEHREAIRSKVEVIDELSHLIGNDHWKLALARAVDLLETWLGSRRFPPL